MRHSTSSRVHRAAGYAMALGFALAAVLARWGIEPWMRGSRPQVTLYGAVALVAWLGGVGPAVVTTAVGLLLTEHFFASPVMRLTEPLSTDSFVGLGAYAVSCGIIIFVADQMRRAEQQVRAASEERTEADVRFRTMVETANEGIWLLDRDARIIFVNPRMAELLGYAPTEMVGRLKWDFLFPEDQPAVRAMFDRRRAGISEQVDVRFRHREGREIFTIMSARPRFNPEGGFIGALDMCTDVTERKLAQIAAQEANERTAQILGSISDGFFVLDREWRYAYVNDSGLEQMHRTREDLIGRCVWDVFPELLGTPFWHHCQQVMAERQPTTFEIRYAAYDAWFENRVYPSPEGIAVFTTDASERKRAEHALQESEARYRSLAEAVPDFVWVAAPDGRAEYVNAQWISYTGLSLADLATIRWDSVAHPDDRDGINEAWAAASHARRPFQAEHRVRRFDGTYRWFLSRAVAMREDDAVLRWVGVSTDITERKAAEDALRETNQLKDQFLMMLGHELRQPLNALHAASRVARLYADGEDALRPLTVIERQVSHLARLVEDLVDVSRVQRGRLELVIRDFDLRGVIEAAAEAVRPTIAHNRQLLRVDLPSAPVPFRGDDARLRQVVLNLLGNAAKHTPEGGIIAVQLQQPEADAVRIRVADTGRGIAPELLPRIFDLFVQGSDSELSGMGIGLALVRGLVELHGGTVTASSEPGAGAEFVVSLPVMPQAEAAAVVAG